MFGLGYRTTEGDLAVFRRRNEFIRSGIQKLVSDGFLGRAIANIYDCAVDQAHWKDTLTHIRDELDTAFVSLQFITFPDGYPERPAETLMFRTEWEQDWLDALQPLIPGIPNIDVMFNSEIDVPMSQMSTMDEADFQSSEFYQEWVKPQGLRDTLNTNIIKRGNMTAVLSSPAFQDRELFSARDFEIIRALAPHFRRALLISDLLDEKNAQVEILRRTLDRLAIAVLLVEPDGRLAHANGAGEDLLLDGDAITLTNRKLRVISAVHRTGFMEAVARACSGNDLDLQSWGNGIPLPGRSGRNAVAYVLPLGKSERRNALGPGMAAVFVTVGQDARPPSVEVISAVTGLTTAEARVALAIADGTSPQEVAERQAVSINTVRKHLANAYEKTGLKNQVTLAAAISRLTPPV